MGLVTFSTAATVKVPLETNFASAIQGYINSLSGKRGDEHRGRGRPGGRAASRPDGHAQRGAGSSSSSSSSRTASRPASRAPSYHSKTSSTIISSVVPRRTARTSGTTYTRIGRTRRRATWQRERRPDGDWAERVDLRGEQGTSRNPSYVYSTSWATPFAAVRPAEPPIRTRGLLRHQHNREARRARPCAGTSTRPASRWP